VRVEDLAGHSRRVQVENPGQARDLIGNESTGELPNQRSNGSKCPDPAVHMIEYTRPATKLKFDD
jgi:hypothetical protein